MIPIKQTKISTHDGSVTGNCFAACVASLLEIPFDEVPQFELDKNWFPPFRQFLLKNGYEYMGHGKPEDLNEYEGLDGYVIVHGDSPRLYVKTGHAVIYRHGILVHDPHPSNDGVLNVQGFYMIERAEFTNFNHEKCEYWPCHDLKKVNCLFCYCPLYHIDDCGGIYKLKNDIKDCSNCTLPHDPIHGYTYIMSKIKK